MANQSFLTLNSPSIEQRVGIYLVPKMLAHAEPWLVLEKMGLSTPLPAHKGATLKWKRTIPFEANTTQLVEGVTPPAQNFRQEIITDTIKQFGAIVNFSDMVADLHEDPIVDELRDAMAQQMATTKELITWEMVRAGTQVIYSGTATARNQVIAPIDIDQIRAAVALLKDNHALKVTSRLAASDGFATGPVNSSYVGVGHTRLEGDIRELDTFTPVEAYGTYRPISEHEIGKVDEVRIILSPDLPPFYGAGAAVGANDVLSRDGVNADVYPLVIMGKDFFGTTQLKGVNAAEVDIRNPRLNTPGDPLGQRGTAVWKMYYSAQRLNESWGVRIESAATEY